MEPLIESKYLVCCAITITNHTQSCGFLYDIKQVISYIEWELQGCE